MKTALVIISIAFLVAIAVLAAMLTGVIPIGHKAPPSSSTNIPAAPTVASPSPGQPPASPAPSTPTPPPTVGSVKFELNLTNITGSGTSRTVTATLTNAGNVDAHNVWAKIQASVGGSPINLNGQPYVRVDIGTLPSGQSVTRQVTLSFSLIDSIKILQQGARLDLTVISDEGQQTFSYDYKP